MSYIILSDISVIAKLFQGHGYFSIRHSVIQDVLDIEF